MLKKLMLPILLTAVIVAGLLMFKVLAQEEKQKDLNEEMKDYIIHSQLAANRVNFLT